MAQARKQPQKQTTSDPSSIPEFDRAMRALIRVPKAEAEEEVRKAYVERERAKFERAKKRPR